MPGCGSIMPPKRRAGCGPKYYFFPDALSFAGYRSVLASRMWLSGLNGLRPASDVTPENRARSLRCEPGVQAHGLFASARFQLCG